MEASIKETVAKFRAEHPEIDSAIDFELFYVALAYERDGRGDASIKLILDGKNQKIKHRSENNILFKT